MSGASGSGGEVRSVVVERASGKGGLVDGSEPGREMLVKGVPRVGVP